jgi:hypothetical protein
MGIFEDMQKLKEYALNEPYKTIIYVVSPQEYERQKQLEAEKQLGIKRPRNG